MEVHEENEGALQIIRHLIKCNADAMNESFDTKYKSTNLQMDPLLPLLD